MTEHRYSDSTGVPYSVDPVRTLWPRCICGSVVPDIDAHIAEQSADPGDYPPAPRNYEKCAACGGDKTLQHHCDLIAEVRNLRERIALMRDLHRPTQEPGGPLRCKECRQHWPCDTSWKLDGLDEKP